MIESPGGLHGFDGVQAHLFKPHLTGPVNDRTCQSSSDITAPILRYHKKPFHLANFALQGAQGHTSHIISAELSQQDAAQRWRITTGQRGQLPTESLEFKINTEGVCILNKKIASILIMRFRMRTNNLYHGQSHHYFL